VAGLSRMYFAVQFRAATGYQPHEYIVQTRIARAKAMLIETDIALSEIAIGVGFSSQAHFSTMFKRVVEETPGRWRSMMRNPGD
jgi:AraC family transcriptional regulator